MSATPSATRRSCGSYGRADGGHRRRAGRRRCRAARRHRATGSTRSRRSVDPRRTPATDDWPFLYLRTPASPPTTSWRWRSSSGSPSSPSPARLAGHATADPRGFSPHFFVLGIAFLLLETRSLVTFSLLFGTTWLVNALAFFAILAERPAAIGVNARFRFRRPGPALRRAVRHARAGLAVPPEQLLHRPARAALRARGGARVRARLLRQPRVHHSFRDTEAADMAFASNLLGAMVGGALEYLALLTGYRALLLVVARPVPAGVPLREPLARVSRTASSCQLLRRLPPNPPAHPPQSVASLPSRLAQYPCPG